MGVTLQVDERTILSEGTSSAVLERFGYPEENSIDNIQAVILRDFEFKKIEPIDDLFGEEHDLFTKPTAFVLKHISEDIEIPLKPNENGIVAIRRD